MLPVQKGREERSRSTLPPGPSFGGAASGRGGRSSVATVPGFRGGAMATAEDGSMMIFMRSQTVRMAAMISSSLADLNDHKRVSQD